jgi:polyhydroxyalkanoate synthase subunit PhaC
MIKLADRLVRALSPSRLDPLGLGQAVWDFWREALTQPNRLLSANLKLAADQLAIANYGARRALGLEAQAPVETPKGDRRFADGGWDEKLFFDLLKQSYLVTSRHILEQVSHGKAGNRSRHKLEFFTRQALDAISPSNFPLTNPEVLDATLQSNGANLIQGMRNLLADLSAGKGRLKVRMVDESQFEVGRNLATAPGKVVFENELMQLIQYAPTTAKVFKRPLLIVPPWINKFYILDLSPQNSFIRWMVAKGYTVFVVSWVNPGKELSRTTFEDYLNKGVMTAIDSVGKATGETDVNMIGYCIGGTLLAGALAIMAETGDKRVRSVTFFAAQVDFSEAGDLLVFIDDRQLDDLEKKMAKQGYLDSQDMATTFNMLRANDLIWTFVVNNYLLGQTPKAFDLLYWNGDSTRLPIAMHTYYLREMYLHNRLVQPGALTMNGVPIDLRKIRIPVFLQSSKEDHIAPYPSVYKATHHYSGPVTFMLAGSGHIAGVINPPDANKYYHYTNEETPRDVADWLAGAEYHEGSWWPYWHRWLSRRSGRKVPARVPGSGGLPAIEDAPGRYVKMK